MTPNYSIIKQVTLGWLAFCYLISLALIPIFPFVTVGFSLPIALMIIFLSPILFVVQGVLIGAMVWLGLTMLGFLAGVMGKRETLNRSLGLR
ncbi:hypothetical protein [Ferrimonas sp.]|uniref:hypothetical protein n=1 Tax=Ferrimonas sp. TaxID=2080861 RepID=UPI003A9134BA